ncbi:ABC transporter permease [Halobellus clavatus]|jgi:putative spermidine/putrescine transport system permease protein|uniref:Putative spermidine/putrescine transport system permease protein n=1 Tax=Halobellus clavatus TaxID=660517 RepID=A0A1H3HIM2_9EURY|nr:ABC transporter permease [Halobellus clavatus]SDY15200.1 putative spermidine/putrescine transport system permease protein [Halobellus clavatus]
MKKISRDSISIHESYLLAGPSVLWFGVFLLIPLGVISYYSFLTYSSFSIEHTFTLKPWISVITSDTIRQVLVETLFTGAVVTLITLVFGYPLAYYLRFHTSQNGGIILLLFLIIPFWTSGVIRTLGWIPVLGKEGVINQLLLLAGLIDQPLSWLLFSPVSQILGYLQNYVVFMAAPIYIALTQVDEGLLDASETLRGSPIATFKNVTWPLSLPGVVIGAIFVFVLSIGNFAVPQFLSGGSSTVSTLIYTTVNQGLDYPAASALSLMLLIVIFGIVYLSLRRVDITELARG